MPRQGARRRQQQAACGKGARTGKRKAAVAAVAKDAEPAEPEPLAGLAEAVRRAGKAADIDAALGAPGDTAEKLFELANKPALRLSIGGGFVEVSQDRSATEHSGGVVWETAVFLARYLEEHVLPGRERPLKVLELGSGCGLLGLAVASLGCKVYLTEQPSALKNLKANVAAHRAAAAAAATTPSPPAPKALQLSWGEDADIAAVRGKGPFDLIIASDVVFAARFVDPLLKTISALLPPAGEGKAECWLCLQQRDPAAHEQLVARAPELFRMKEISFEGLEGFEAAAELDCLLLRLTPRKRARVGEAAGAEVQAPAPEQDEGLEGEGDEVQKPKAKKSRTGRKS